MAGETAYCSVEIVKLYPVHCTSVLVDTPTIPGSLFHLLSPTEWREHVHVLPGSSRFVHHTKRILVAFICRHVGWCGTTFPQNGYVTAADFDVMFPPKKKHATIPQINCVQKRLQFNLCRNRTSTIVHTRTSKDSHWLISWTVIYIQKISPPQQKKS